MGPEHVLTLVGDTETRTVRVRHGATVLDALHDSGWDLVAPCGGRGRCGKCVIYVDSPDDFEPKTDLETAATGESATRRLACKCIPIADATVRLAPLLTTTNGDWKADVEMDSSADRRADPNLPAEQRGRPGEPCLGVGIDIGTTTVAAYLVDTVNHRMIGSVSEANAQASHGADVITRISAEASGAPLTSLIRSQVNKMTKRLADAFGADPRQIAKVAVVGNPTMTHIYAGLSPESIGTAPFVSPTTGRLTLSGEETDLAIAPACEVTILPCVSGYVGSDVVAGVIASGIHKEPHRSLLIDVGTNGEIVLGSQEGLVACSTAAGPAFEGATISCGLGGVPGAVVAVCCRDRRLTFSTVGSTDVRGITGAGLIDAMAMLLDHGIIDTTGRIISDGETEEECSCVGTTDRKSVLLSATNGEIRLTQQDIREVQLAKAAIAGGLITLFEMAGVRPDSITTVYLAGGFGSYLNPDSAFRIGLLPGIKPEQVRVLGNAAGSGAVAALVDPDALAEADTVAGQCRYLELADTPVFQAHFVSAMHFPSGAPR
jgi:uncharacterized 2Fe-2S/4Fe-4S cluster protein (DUF4445 family)